MATHSSILAWRIPWAEEPGGLQSTGSQSQTRLKGLSKHTGCLLRVADASSIFTRDLAIISLYIQRLIKEMSAGFAISSLLFLVNFPSLVGLLSIGREFGILDKNPAWDSEDSGSCLGIFHWFVGCLWAGFFTWMGFSCTLRISSVCTSGYIVIASIIYKGQY